MTRPAGACAVARSRCTSPWCMARRWFTLLLIVLVAGKRWRGFPLSAYGWMLALALIPQLIGHSTLNWALRHLSATFVAAATLAEPVASSALAYLVLRGEDHPADPVGRWADSCGIYVASRSSRWPSRRLQ